MSIAGTTNHRKNRAQEVLRGSWPFPQNHRRIPAFRGKHYFVFSTTCAGSKSKGWNPCVYFFRHRPGLREHCGPRSVNAVGSVDAGHQCKRFAAPSRCRSQTRLVHRICVVLTTSPAALPSPPCETSLAIRVKPLPALNHFINVCRFKTSLLGDPQLGSLGVVT